MAGAVFAQDALPPGLTALAETEREFARTAKVKGVRDSFLDFFAPDAIALTPDPVSARERLLQQEATPASADELLWEPRTGDVAAGGDLGWLTGPSTFIDHRGPDQTPRHGNYLSIWRKHPDGQWRVFIDVGIGLPAAAPFAPGLTRTGVSARYAGKEGKAAASASLLEADRRLNASLARDGAVKAYDGVVMAGTRLHRPGALPPVGPEAIARWMTASGTGMTAVSTTAESAASADLGYAYGTYEATAPKPQAGAYVRVWSRDADGRWVLVADVTQPAPPRK
ncbi:MAG: nuclear transport factor 2 family protein [Vicinamibacterales bacterium]